MSNMISREVLSLIGDLKEVLGDNHFTFNTPYTYTIEVCGVDNSSRIWIRLGTGRYGIIFDISTIELDRSLRHKGVFSKLVKKIIKNRYVESIRVTSVCTDEMHMACRKLNMEYDPMSYTYTLNKIGGIR